MSKRWIIAGGVVAALLVAAAVYTVLRYRTFYSPSASMAPTIVTGQIFVVDRFAYRGAAPRRGDVVVFMPPVISPSPFFKRVVAVPGDRLAIRAGRTFVDGKRVDEPYAPWPAPYDLAVRDYGMTVDGAPLDTALAFIPPRAAWTSPDTVPRGCYVVLGDNRPNSADSHVFGFLCPGQPVPNLPNVHPQLIGRAIVTR
ncbi:MAG: signal peptidase I [Candidatus Eremiobacteraeota bacterium]|nr:signal peptidase I [Candidatus Eremiobacteraeota bacterium]